MNQPWRQIQVTVPSALAEDVRLLMQRRAGRAVAVEDGFAACPPDESIPTGSCRVTAWFPASEKAEAAAAALLCDLWMAGGLDAPSLRSVRQSYTDRAQWLACEAFYQRPVNIGRLVIVPAGGTVPVGTSADRVLTIDAAGAFGSGLHASTRGALLLLQALDLADKSVLDVGTGTGVLAIASARLGAAAVVAIDNDGEAVTLAQANIVRNRCESVVQAQRTGPCLNLLDGRPRFDLVVANITADTHRRLLPAYARAAAGPLLLSGVYRPRLPELTDAIKASGFALALTAFEDEWATLLCERPAAAGRELSG